MSHEPRTTIAPLQWGASALPMTSPAAISPSRPRVPPPPGLPGSEGLRAPLSAYEWHAISTLTGQNVLVIEIEAQERKQDDWQTVPFQNREVTQVGTSDVVFARANPNRVALFVFVLGGVPVLVRPDRAASTSAAMTIQPNGGFLRVVGNDVQVVAPSSSRAAPYDRNPTTIVNTGAQSPGAAALADTTNWTYTVPAGRKAFIESAFVWVLNNAVVALNNNATSRLQLTPSGGATQDMWLASAPLGVASYFNAQTFAAQAALLAGDSIRDRMNSNNNAAGSNVNLQSGLKATEFDA